MAVLDMASNYTNGGYDKSTHVHRLERINEPPYKYRCLQCGARLQKLSGIVVQPRVKASEPA